MAQSAQIQKLNPWHVRFADWLICNPDKKLSDASKHFGRSVPWLSTVLNSDAFQDYFQELSRSHSEAIALSVREKTLGLADQAISKLQEIVETKGDDLPPAALVSIADMALKRTGHGEAVKQPQVSLQLNLVDSGVLKAARERMRSLTIEAQPLLEAASSARGVGAEDAAGASNGEVL